VNNSSPCWTGAYGGGQGANGQLISWSNSTGTHLVGEKAYFSAGRAISDIPLKDLMGPGVIVDISDLVEDYDLITPEMITSRADVRPGDILIINTGYHRYSLATSSSSTRATTATPGTSPTSSTPTRRAAWRTRNSASSCGILAPRWSSTSGPWT